MNNVALGMLEVLTANNGQVRLEINQPEWIYVYLDSMLSFFAHFTWKYTTDVRSTSFQDYLVLSYTYV